MRGLGHAGPVTCMTEMTSAVGANAKGDWIVTGGVDHNLMVRRCWVPLFRVLDLQGSRDVSMDFASFLEENKLGRRRFLL
jgi:hypothetical protein